MPHSVNPVDRMLLQNKAWAFDRVQSDPSFFKRLSNTQKPEVLWIGCSDSRVPANEITNTGPGEIFVHRNIANLVRPGDVNSASVLEYAVGVLKVRSIVVVGHRGCGGIRASMGSLDGFPATLVDWLGSIREVYAKHAKELDALAEGEARENALLGHVVRTQVENLAKMDVVQRHWAERQAPSLHGMVYSTQDGRLQELCRASAGQPMAMAVAS
ncbi:MAG: carbonic anhydrase [Myxococcota bacterium]|nr:carbonic anhydrase [Myxococcota bacterium]